MKDRLMNELSGFLTGQFRPLQIELELGMVLSPRISISITVAKILKEYQSTESDEDHVCDLLEGIMKLHLTGF